VTYGEGEEVKYDSEFELEEEDDVSGEDAVGEDGRERDVDGERRCVFGTSKIDCKDIFEGGMTRSGYPTSLTSINDQ